MAEIDSAGRIPVVLGGTLPGALAPSPPVRPGCSLALDEFQQACIGCIPGFDGRTPACPPADAETLFARRRHIGYALASLSEQATYWGLTLGECALAAAPELRQQPAKVAP